MLKRETRAIELIRARLDPNHPGFMGSDAIRNALQDDVNVRVYLASHVLPLLDMCIEGEEAFPGQTHYLTLDHSRMVSRAKSRE